LLRRWCGKCRSRCDTRRAGSTQPSFAAIVWTFAAANIWADAVVKQAALPATRRLYLDGAETAASEFVLACREHEFACAATCFYPGGGGQPCDCGTLTLIDGRSLAVLAARADESGVIWHALPANAAGDLAGQPVALAVDRARRQMLSRYHTVLHLLNTIALREYDGWITGAQMATDYARIDFKLDRITPELCRAIEDQVNAVSATASTLRAYTLAAAEFNARGDLLRTLDVRPPVLDGRVRVVEIDGFDAQACGGTLVHSTAEIGSLSIYKTENKGRNNKRLYVRLSEPARPG